LAVVSNFSLTLVIAVNLLGIVVLDAGVDCVEQVEQLCGGLVGEAWKSERQDDGVAFHWTSSSAL
jgi:hypothetical protein